jgi:hypothetical protein
MKRIFILALFTGCCGIRPPNPIQSPLAPEPNPSEVTHRILAYGDTRTGAVIFENQDNAGEAVHDWVASQMVARLGNEKADVVFTGDSVYAGGATFHYDNFVEAISRFKAAGLNYFPCVGNHELLAGIIGVISPWFEAGGAEAQTVQASTPHETQWKEFIADRHNELKKPGHQNKIPKHVVDKLDARSKAMENQILPKLEADSLSRSAADRIESGRRVMESIYVKRAGFQYLSQFYITEKRTFYSIESISKKPTVLMMMLDTNSLDYLLQKQWFKETLAASKHDLILVFGHHPPGTIEGWDSDYMSAFKSHKKAVIWVTSHVHAFVYAFPEAPAGIPSRALFISGGGGAPLVESDEQAVPIRGWKFGPANDLDGRFFHFLDIRTTENAVFVTVLGCLKKGEPMKVKATYKVRLP